MATKVDHSNLGANSDTSGSTRAEKSKNPFNRFIAMILALFSPIIWTLAANGLIKAFLALFTAGFHVLDTTSQSYLILSALGDAFIYFIPIALAVSASRFFKVNVGASIAIAGFLVYPAIYGLFQAGEPVAFFGIPVVMAPYVYSVFPMVVAIWLQSILEPWLMKVVPSWMRNFTVPFLLLLIVGLVTLMVVGPIITAATNLVDTALIWSWGPAPWLGGFLMGMFWQVFVMFGLHWGLSPIMMNEIAANGHSLLFGALPSAVAAQCATALAVAIRTKDQKLRQMALPTSIAGFFSGVTEPIVYGVTLPLKKPFIIAITAGGIGGAIAASGGSDATANIFASLLTRPAFLGVGNFAMQLLGVAVAIAVAFIGTLYSLVCLKSRPEHKSITSLQLKLNPKMPFLLIVLQQIRKSFPPTQSSRYPTKATKPPILPPQQPGLLCRYPPSMIPYSPLALWAKDWASSQRTVKYSRPSLAKL